MSNKYGVKSLLKDFPNDDKCLDYIFDTLHSRKCSCGGEYKRIKGRKQYQCSKCRFQIAPTSCTIFHKSDTSLTLWFRAILTFSNAKIGISAKYLQRELEVTYKCAWRILSQIRKALKQDATPLRGIVETDIAYVGGRKYAGKNNENMSEAQRAKSVVMIAMERNGKMKAKISENSTADEIENFVKNNIVPKSFLVTDTAKAYGRINKNYDHLTVNHSKGEYARENVHTNNVETWIAHLKRSLRGTFKSVSKKHLQSYLDAFVFHYNNRHSGKDRFSALIGALLQTAK